MELTLPHYTLLLQAFFSSSSLGIGSGLGWEIRALSNKAQYSKVRKDSASFSHALCLDCFL